MRLHRPSAKFCLKLDSNRRLIDFFNPNSWSLIKSSWLNGLYLVWFIFKKSIYIENRLNLIKNGQKRLDFWSISMFLITFDHFRLDNQHWHDNFWSFNQKNDWKQIKIDQLKLKLDQNCDRRYDLVIEI